jgi:hypothetical protein
MRRRRTYLPGTMAQAVLDASAPRVLRGSGISSPPYDPWKVAEYLRIPVRDAPISGAGLDGYVEHIDGWPAIVLNADAPRTRRRFTLGHELAHVLLMLRMKRADGLKLGLKRYADGGTPSVGTASDPVEERLCDRFAAELLMPRKDVIDYWRRRPITAQGVRDCASFFEVSLFTACSRSVMFLPCSNASYWQREPWPMSEWERGVPIPRRARQSLGAFVEDVFGAKRRQASTRKSFEEFDLHADAAVCGRQCLLLVVRRGPESVCGAAPMSSPGTPVQEHLPWSSGG